MTVTIVCSAGGIHYQAVQRGPSRACPQQSQRPAADVKHTQSQTKTAAEERLFESQGVLETALPQMDSHTSTFVFNTFQSVDCKYDGENSHRVGSARQLMLEGDGDEYFDLGPHHQKVGNGWRMESPQEGARWASKTVNQKKDLWDPSLDRESNLEVVKSGSLYDIRAYKGEKTKPSKLYDDDTEDLRYQISPGDILPEKAEELEDERQELIRSQVVRKSNTVAERWSSMDELETINAASSSKGTPEGRRSYFADFAMCFDSPPSSRVSSTPVDPQNIDTEQIDFATARRQFLELEKTNPDVLLGPRKDSMSKTTPRMQTMQNFCGGELLRNPGANTDGYNQRSLSGASEKAVRLIPQTEGPLSSDEATIWPNSTGDHLDSGLIETPRSLSIVTPVGQVSEKKEGYSLDWAADETPIEREIRLSLEREDDHRKERGIHRENSRDELVEIRSKPLLSSTIALPISSTKGKDKPRVSFNIQREIEQETQREMDLQREGRLLGMYDKGLGQDLAECRKVFEQDETNPTISLLRPRKKEEIQDTTNVESAQIHHSFASDTDNLESLPRQKVHRSLEAYELSSFNQSSTISNQQMDLRTRSSSTVELPKGHDEEAVLRREHFAIPIQKLRFSTVDNQGPPSVQRKEHRPEWAVPREDLYTLKSWRPRTSALIDQEIQEDLQREVELQEQRRKTRLTAERETTQSRTSSQSSAASGIADSYSVCASPIYTPDTPARLSPSLSPQQVNCRRVSSEPNLGMHHQSLAQASMEDEKRKRQREDGKYAGIELSDEIDSEVVKSTKAIRQRGFLAQLWETGQIHTIGDDSD